MSSAYYKRLLAQEEKELKDYKKRKTELESIRSNYRSFDTDANDLNRHYMNIFNYIRSAIIISGGSNDPSGLWGRMDTGSGDTHLSSSRSCVDAEITRVENKIFNLMNYINYLKAMIADEEAKEKA